MRISKLRLAMLRSFLSAAIEFSPTITVIVGENNSGKTTLLHSLMAIQQPKLGVESLRFGSHTATIAVTLADLDPTLFHEALRPSVEAAASPGVTVEVAATISHAPDAVAYKTIFSTGGTSTFSHFANERPRNLLAPYLSTRRTENITDNIGAVYAYSVNSGHHHLSAKIDACCTSRELQIPFRQACQEVLGFPITTWPVDNGKQAGLEIDARKRHFIPLTQMGAGVSHAVGLIVELLVAGNKIFLIEELENDLHPDALRILLTLIERSAQQGNQFIISTHSNVVVRFLGGISGTRIYRIDRIASSMPPESQVSEVPNLPSARRALLSSLGYDLMDYDLYSAWLILEESSAEAIIREFLIPWFAPRLSGRLRTIAAKGAGDVEARFVDLHRLMTFVHLEPIYTNRAWVWCDGDQAGKEAIAKLRGAFPKWPKEHFVALDADDFEHYYPAEFSTETTRVMAIGDRPQKRDAKKSLCDKVVRWLRADEVRGKAALKASAAAIIERLASIEAAVLASNK